MTRVEMKAVEIILDIYVSTFGHFNTHFLVVKDQRLSTFICLPPYIVRKWFYNKSILLINLQILYYNHVIVLIKLICDT